MFKIFLTVGLVICISMFELAADEVEYVGNEGVITKTLEIFPKEIKIGDTIYFVIKATNNTDTARSCYDLLKGGAYNGSDLWIVGFDEIKIFVFDGKKKCEIYPYMYLGQPTLHISGGGKRTLIAPRSSVLLFYHDVRVISLEDLYTSFWLDLQKNLSHQGKELEFCVEFNPFWFGPQDIFKTKIKILPREKNEMKILENWYRNTPKHLLPELNLDHPLNNKPKSPPKWLRKILKDKYGEYNTVINISARHRNLYPNYSNFPNDWQGWKKLEESFCGGTLRDEIRWTRICLQYCTTADEKVLDELKSWLEQMNPIQRAVMVNYFRKDKNLPNSEKLYNTIQQFKIIPKKD